MDAEQLFAEYEALLHAMQAGVEFDSGHKDQQPKHLRVGINAAMSDHGALVAVLIAKGVLTEQEYAESLVRFMRAEVERYRQRLGQKYGVPLEGVCLT